MPADKPTRLPRTAVEPLPQLLQRLVEVYRQCRALGDRQSALIQAQDGVALSQLLDQRQALINQAVALHTQAAERWAREGDQHAEDQPVVTLQREADALRQAIIEQDQSQRTAILELRGALGQQLQATSQAQKAVSAYQSAGRNRDDNRFTNRQG